MIKNSKKKKTYKFYNIRGNSGCIGMLSMKSRKVPWVVCNDGLEFLKSALNSPAQLLIR